MDSGTRRLVTGSIAAGVFVLAIGGLVASGGGLFDSQTGADDACSNDVGTCPSMKQAGTVATAIEDAGICPEEGGCRPSMTKTPPAATPADAIDVCSGCADGGKSAAAGRGGKKECRGDGSCGSGSADN